MNQVPGISLFIILSTIVIVSLLFLILKQPKRWIALLAGSLFFYTLQIGYQIVVPLLFSIIIYTGGLYIQKAHSIGKSGKKEAIIFIILSLLPMLIEKLLPLFPSASNMLPPVEPEYLDFHANVFEVAGISFFTLNGIGYLIDVRKKYTQPERNYALLLLYILFFPIILAGPLQRSGNLLHQFRHNLQLSNENFSRGFRLVLWGLFKNFLIAHKCFYLLSQIQMNNPKGLLVILQGFSFFFYLYFSFSSYIDLFIGVARIFNVELSNNFGNRVYAATSRKNFWAEWHITLNHWFRDYFFFPLAKKIKTRSAFNVAILSTFILIGFWHGISIRYALWGLINGVWILLEQKLTPLFKSFPVRFRKYGGLFYHLLLASMVAILFSANNPLSMYRNLLMPTSIDEVVVKSLIKNCVFLSVLIFLFDKLSRNMGSSTFDLHVAKLPMTTRWLLYMLLTSAILIFTFTGRIQNYYFKF